VENNLLSVTITADDSIDADALSTAAFALGWEKGQELIAGVEGAGGIFVFDDLSVRVMENLKEAFSLTAAEYRLKVSTK
jgi:thiamine biosynthesis lipoprotein